MTRRSAIIGVDRAMESWQGSKDVILREVVNFARNELLEKSQLKLVAWTRIKVCAECPLSDVCERPCPKALKFFFANRVSVIRALTAWN